MVETHLKNNYIDWIPVKEGEQLLVLAERMENLRGSWDYIVVGDAFARIPGLISGNDPYQQFFGKLKEHLNPGGKVVLAVDNRYGLQFFAGCKERLTGAYFEGIEGYTGSEGVRTFSKTALLEMIKEAGFFNVKTYYPYPNFRYMTALYSDSHLPSPGTLNQNLCNFEEDRAVLFDEGKVFDGLIKEGRFEEFSNSYLMVFSLEAQEAEEEVTFLKYSVERRAEYRIRTEIVKKSDGSKVVRKVPYGTESVNHVKQLKHWEEVLSKAYNPVGVLVNRCTMTEKGAEFEFLKGELLEDLLDGYVQREDFTGFMEAVKGYANKLEELLKPEPFVVSDRFREVFGAVEFQTPQVAAKVNNIDLIFSNILITNGVWNVIDYEWTFDFAIPMKFILHRAIALYFEQKKLKSLQCKDICRMVGITEGEQKLFLEMEHRLQCYLLGETKTMEALQQEYAGRVINLKELLYRGTRQEMKIYYDFGQGFSEADTAVAEVPEDFYGRRRWKLCLPPNVTAVRIDPCEQACLVTVNRLLGECSGTYEVLLGHNGSAYEQSILYTTSDPQLLVTGIVPGTGQLHVDITVEYLKEETGYLWMKLLKKAEKCDRMEASKAYRWLKKIKNLVKKG